MYSRYVSYSPPCIAIRIVFVTWCIRSSPTGYIFRVACNNIMQATWVGGSGLVVVLSLSSVPEATGSCVHDVKNMHMLLPCSRPIFFLPIILYPFSGASVFFLVAFLLSLASASITSKEPVCPRVELILKITIILLIIFLGFIKSKPC